MTEAAASDVRNALDVDALNRFVAQNVPDVIEAPVVVKQFGFGQSNPTYSLTDNKQRRFVMRKKPAGTLLSSSAHAVEREYRVLNALTRHNDQPSTRSEDKVPVPRPIVLCEDTSVIGTPFYIMEFLEGRIFEDPKLLNLEVGDRRACWLSAVNMLSRLARLNPHSLGLSSFGSSKPFFPRQLRSLSALSRSQALTVSPSTSEPIGDLPYFEEGVRWYTERLPCDDKMVGGARIVHGDFKIDNLVFHPTEPRVIGILDWELSTLGNPLGDFANLLLPFYFGPAHVSSSPSSQANSYLSTGFVGAPSYTPPIPSSELEEVYRRLTDYHFSAEEFGAVKSWMMFRNAVGIQGIAARAAKGQSSSSNASEFAKSFGTWAIIAKELRDAVSLTPEEKQEASLAPKARL